MNRLPEPNPHHIQASDLENFCWFCGERFVRDRYDEYTEEVGEVLPKSDPTNYQSVLVHPDCVMWEDIQQYNDKNWVPA